MHCSGLSREKLVAGLGLEPRKPGSKGCRLNHYSILCPYTRHLPSHTRETIPPAFFVASPLASLPPSNLAWTQEPMRSLKTSISSCHALLTTFQWLPMYLKTKIQTPSHGLESPVWSDSCSCSSSASSQASWLQSLCYADPQIPWMLWALSCLRPLNFLFFLPGVLFPQDLCMDGYFSSFKGELKCHLREAFPPTQCKCCLLSLVFVFFMVLTYLDLDIYLLVCLWFVFFGRMWVPQEQTTYLCCYVCCI